MAVKSKEMTASAMKVVIRKHLVCVSLTIKTGTRRSPGVHCGKQKAGAALFPEGSPSQGALMGAHPQTWGSTQILLGPNRAHC